MLGIIGLVSLGVASVLAVVFGHQELAKIKKSDGQRGGRRHAITGLTLGYVGLTIGVVVLTVTSVFG